MRLELLIFSATLFFMYNTYHDGKYMHLLFSYQKYYTMILYFLLGLGMVVILKRNPNQGKEMIHQTNSLLQSLPFNKEAILDLTKKQGGSSSSTKRCVSETKKKFVAARQDWKCNICKYQLDHTYEVDHTIRLEYGGSNDVDNLVALCRNCHGKKTAAENMNMN